MGRRAKRCLDVVGAASGLVLGAPILAATAAAIRVSMGGPVLFTQERAGLNGRPFRIYKFRTMSDARGPDGAPLPDDQRLTRVGRFVRSTSMDELPQLWNVLKGEMSLVGPRPLLLEYLPLYDARQARRHEVKPGITTWNAVNGRNAMSWEQQFEYDVWYVDHVSLALDLKILAKTVGKVLQREGITQDGRATRDRFRGTAASSA
jgi:lipopolysaccharide/colanic/teichoic acid biosynthesis glycosyltransferase